MNDSKVVLTPGELAKRWDITPKTLKDWRRDGKGPRWFAPGGGSTIRYRIEDVLAHEEGLVRGGDDLAVSRALDEYGITVDEVAAGKFNAEAANEIARIMARAMLGQEQDEVTTHG